MMEQYEQTKIVEAIDLTHDALGVCKLEDGYTVFVADMLKGEKAEIIVTQRKKSYGFGKVVQRLEKSPFRVTPKCTHFYECGGCALMHMDYDVQLSFKKYRVESSLKRNGIDFDNVDDIIGMNNPYYYRNKIEIKFYPTDKGIEAGFFRQKSHSVVNLTECHIMSKKMFEVVNLTKNLLNEFGVKAYNEETKTGFVKSMVIRESFKTKQITILFHTEGKDFPNKEGFIKKLQLKMPEVVGASYQNTKDESSFSEDNIYMLFGVDSIIDQINGLDFKIGFQSFFQTNTLQTEKLYQKAIEYAQLTGKEKIIDAYCGIGSIGLSAASQCYKVFGIEVVKQAINDAKSNAEINQIENVFFEVGQAESVIKKWRKYRFDLVFVDPPRKGCDVLFLNTLIEMKVKKIVYISCDQATLGRDLKVLVDNGYEVKKVTPVDMFPQTSHVESVTLLSLKANNSKV